MSECTIDTVVRQGAERHEATVKRGELVMISPVTPAPTGNGLAMRAGMQLEALAASYDVRLVVVPVAGGSSDLAWARQHAATAEVVRPGGSPDLLRRGTVDLVADPAWRARLARAEPLPELTRLASPALAGAVAAAAGTDRAPVHAIRAYLAPLAVAVAERCRAPWSTLDLDDDDERLLAELGRGEEARAYGRLVGTFAGAFAWVSLASPDEAAAVAKRHRLPTIVVPNAVAVEDPVARGSRHGQEPLTLLLVSNLTYEPNVDAAERLARGVLPRVRRLLGSEVDAELVGTFEPGGRVDALGALDGVHLAGHVDDLRVPYSRADVVVAPLAHGAGTRIKVLEALSFGVPVVTSPAGAAGLGARDGIHLLLADGAEQTAAAVARVAIDHALADSLVQCGRALVLERFDRSAVCRQLVELMPTG